MRLSTANLTAWTGRARSGIALPSSASSWRMTSFDTWHVHMHNHPLTTWACQSPQSSLVFNRLTTLQCYHLHRPTCVYKNSNAAPLLTYPNIRLQIKYNEIYNTLGLYIKWQVNTISMKTGVMHPKFGGGYSLKRYAPKLPFAWKQNIISSTYTNNHGSRR